MIHCVNIEKIDFLDDNSPIALDKLEQVGFELPVLVHPKGYVSLSAVLGKGTIVPEGQRCQMAQSTRENKGKTESYLCIRNS